MYLVAVNDSFEEYRRVNMRYNALIIYGSVLIG
jgi:hypothetical protein